ncbi:MAG: extracellular solute-binding protein [Firmicutes bacterium]|nr:extracellular solute-binding protein [Bacillota bacterium]
MLKKKVIVLLLFLVLMVQAGCQDQTGEIESAGSTNPKMRFTYWVPLEEPEELVISSLEENEVYKELVRRTGIEFDFISVKREHAEEAFNLMLASGDLPDIIQNPPHYYGGSEKAVRDGIYLKLNDLIDRHAPNFKRLLDNNPQIKKEVQNDLGTIWGFPLVHLEEEPSWYGPIIREDWLEELGLGVPETIEEWYDVLKAFKEEKGAEVPLLFRDNYSTDNAWSILSAYGVTKSFVKVDDIVLYGPIQPAYKAFLKEMNQWYEEGLIDSDFAMRNYVSFSEMAVSGKAGAWFGRYGEDLDDFLIRGQRLNPQYRLTAAPYPSLKKGDRPEYRQKNWLVQGYWGVITSSCQYPVEIVKWFDYHYSDEAFVLFNYGVEGVSYDLVEGKPVYKDFISNNEDGYGYYVLREKYKWRCPYIRDFRAVPLQREEVRKAQEIWTNSAGDALVIPPVSLLPTESVEYEKIMDGVQYYVEEMTVRFIMGIENIENFDDYVKRVKALGIDRAVAIRQAALNRYNSR